MTKPIKVVTAPVKLDGEFGGIFPQAIVAFYNMSKFSCESLEASHSDTHYTARNDVEEIAYSASFWYNQETKAAGFKARPVENLLEDSDEQLYTFSIDVTDPKYANILSQPGDSWDSVMRVVELHYRTEVAK